LLPPIVPPPLLASKIVASHCTSSDLLPYCFADTLLTDFIRLYLPAADCRAAPAMHISNR
jgi:hypothetical protein